MDISFVNMMITKICHDLISPIGSAKMALEMLKEKSETTELLNKTIDQAIITLDLFRSVFSNNKSEITTNAFEKYIKQNNLNLQINQTVDQKIFPLLFFLSQKMLAKSKIIYENNILTISEIHLTLNEIASLQGKEAEINPSNILPYLAYAMLKKPIIVEQIEHKKWQLTY